MPKENSDFKRLLQRLSEAGFDRRHLRVVFPSWWTDDAAREPSALVELKIVLSRRLGIELESLLSDESDPKIVTPNGVRYKLREGTTSVALRPATGSLAALATTVSAASSHLPRAFVSEDPENIRREILGEGANWLSLKGLLNWSWNNGVPVIPTPNLPGKRKMDAAVISPGDRPVVFLTKNQSFSAWQLFILAHELGHLGRGHVKPEHSLVDDDLGEGSAEAELRDDEEVAADLWAKRLLAVKNSALDKLRLCEHPRELARLAQEEAKKHQTDAGHLILRVAFQTDNWQLANAALSVLEPEPQGLELARQAARLNLDLGAVADDSREFLEGMISG